MNRSERIQAMIDANHCPTCPFHGSFYQYGQGAICTRCPVFVCSPFPDPPDEEDKPGYHTEMTCLVEPDDYREDWLEDWERFFRTGERPELRLQRREK